VAWDLLLCREERTYLLAARIPVAVAGRCIIVAELYFLILENSRRTISSISYRSSPFAPDPDRLTPVSPSGFRRVSALQLAGPPFKIICKLETTLAVLRPPDLGECAISFS
jgi:hypothetical protein